MALPNSYTSFIPDHYYARLAEVESSGNPFAKNPNSSAKGLYQFIDSTGAQYGLNNYKFGTAAYTRAEKVAVRMFTEKNFNSLKSSIGRDPSFGELYLAHQQGVGGAKKLLQNPGGNAAATLGSSKVRLNGGHTGMTNQEFANLWINKFENGIDPNKKEPAWGGDVNNDSLIGGMANDLLNDNKGSPSNSGTPSNAGQQQSNDGKESGQKLQDKLNELLGKDAVSTDEEMETEKEQNEDAVENAEEDAKEDQIAEEAAPEETEENSTEEETNTVTDTEENIELETPDKAQDAETIKEMIAEATADGFDLAVLFSLIISEFNLSESDIAILNTAIKVLDALKDQGGVADDESALAADAEIIAEDVSQEEETKDNDFIEAKQENKIDVTEIVYEDDVVPLEELPYNTLQNIDHNAHKSFYNHVETQVKMLLPELHEKISMLVNEVHGNLNAEAFDVSFTSMAKQYYGHVYEQISQGYEGSIPDIFGGDNAAMINSVDDVLNDGSDHLDMLIEPTNESAESSPIAKEVNEIPTEIVIETAEHYGLDDIIQQDIM